MSKSHPYCGTNDTLCIRGIAYATRRRQRGYLLGPAFAVLAWLGLLLLGVTVVGQILDRDHAIAEHQAAQQQRTLSWRVAR